MALDLIDAVGPGGEFLTAEHTLKHFKKNWYPELMSRAPYEKWVSEGSKDLKSKATAKVQHIIEHHEPKPLDNRLKSELRKIIESKE